MAKNSNNDKKERKMAVSFTLWECASQPVSGGGKKFIMNYYVFASLFCVFEFDKFVFLLRLFFNSFFCFFIITFVLGDYFDLPSFLKHTVPLTPPKSTAYSWTIAVPWTGGRLLFKAVCTSRGRGCYGQATGETPHLSAQCAHNIGPKFRTLEGVTLIWALAHHLGTTHLNGGA